MAVTGVLGARLYTSATALTNIEGAADAIGDFQGLTIATEIGLIDNFGELGRTFDTVPFQDVATGRTHKLRGGHNDGQMQITFGQDLSDAGQAAVKSQVAANQDTYPYKLTIEGGDGSYDTFYFGAKAMSFVTNLGAVNAALRATLRLEINTPIFIGGS